MRWFQVIDTQTGAKHNALAADIESAKRSQAAAAATGLAGRRGTPVAGSRYSVEGETFDVAFHMEAIQGAQPSRSERGRGIDWRTVSVEQARKLSASDRVAVARSYDRGMNEGGEGYNPYRGR